MCGGTEYPTWLDILRPGLSPRVRGNPTPCCSARSTPGSIPACAGEPSAMLDWMPLRVVYPRVCGGTTSTLRHCRGLRGLSPRVRGNPVGLVLKALIVGSIPACAGEPPVATPSSVRQPVYPRVCGGTRRFAGQPVLVRGLSPRVRGNRRVRPATRAGQGSIPACAGEPLIPSISQHKAGVYPRVCGGTSEIVRRALMPVGLSPRVRGNPPFLSLSHPCRRSIPACAGEPTSAPPWMAICGVYPRVCGGTSRWTGG